MQDAQVVAAVEVQLLHPVAQASHAVAALEAEVNLPSPHGSHVPAGAVPLRKKFALHLLQTAPLLAVQAEQPVGQFTVHEALPVADVVVPSPQVKQLPEFAPAVM